MNRKFFMLAVISLLCLFTYGCGSHEIESENSSPIIETVTETSVATETQTSCTLITAKTDIVSTAVTSATVSETSQQVTVASSVQNTAVATSTTFKSPSGETNFKTITNQHAQYEPRVPSVLKPHEPVIYTTAPPDSENPSEAITTLVSDIIETEPPEESSENNSPEPVTPDELYFYGMTPSDDIKDLIGSFGEYESMTSTAGEYSPDEVQAENRHYYFSNMELITFVYDDMEILGEVIIKDDTFLTSRNISIGMTADDVVSAYGNGEFYDNIYRYQTDTGYIYFHVDENNIVDYIGMHGIY
ncbi:MAG TPA: hypothetical protein DCQ78_01475 [Ruminococcus sp.]|nr:hypothetical protein [Ruminococcus sp.]